MLLTVAIVPSNGSPEIDVSQLPVAADYQIYRGDTSSWTFVADLGALDPAAGGSCVDTTTTLQNDTTYHYGVFDDNGNLLDSATLVIAIHLSGNAVGNAAHLSWDGNSAFNFHLSGGNTGSDGVHLGNASSYTDTGLAYNSWYGYTLDELTTNAWSSIEVWTPPSAMAGITAQLVHGFNEIDIAATGWGTGSYGVMNLYRGTTPDFTLDADHRIASGVASFADTNVAPGTRYYYQATNLAPYTGLESTPVTAFAATAGGEPVVAGRSIHATAGTAYNGTIATFYQASPFSDSDFTATIDWGDGSPAGSTQGTTPDLVVSIDPQHDTYIVTGTHTYAIGSRISASAVVTVTRSASGAQGSATDPVTISRPAAEASSIYIHAGDTYQGVIATFTNNRPGALATDFTATVDYSDGVGPVGATVQATSTPGTFRILGKVSYDTEGNKSLTVNITDTVQGGSKSLNGTAHVTPSIRAAKGIVGIKGPREGQAFSGQVATFTDSNTSAGAGPYKATINWLDDGRLTEEASVSGGGGKWSVNASGHVFKDEGNQMFSVSIHTGTHVLLAVGTVDVRDAIIHAIPGCNAAHLPLGQTEGPGWFLPDDQAVAGFHDDYAQAPIGDYSTVIHWGDGSTSAGTIVGGPPKDDGTPSGDYAIVSGHTYETLPYEPWVAIKDDGVIVAVTTFWVTLEGGIPDGMKATPGDREPKLPPDNRPGYDPNDPTQTNITDPTPIKDPPPPPPPEFDDSGTLALSGEPTGVAEGHEISAGTLVGTFTDSQTLSDPNDPLSQPLNSANYTATARLPDGTALPVYIDGSDGTYNLRTSTSTAAFTEETNADQSIAISVAQGIRTVDSDSPFHVSDASLTADAPPSNLQMQPGQSQTQTVATFSDGDPNANAGDFKAMVDWGDGTAPSAGIVTAIAGGGFAVLGTHNYTPLVSD